MPSRRPPAEAPPLYAMTLPGLEPIVADEITDDLGAEVKRTGRGIVVFRVDQVDAGILDLRTTEDVFLLAWGTDALTYRAEDLKAIRRWTAQGADWSRLLNLHHTLRPRPRGKPTYHLVTQMHGQHGYRRVDALKALADGLGGHLPASWRPAAEIAAVEIWLSIDGRMAVCGLRLSDRTMRHRPWKQEHLPASLRPTLAAALVRLAEPRADMVLLDPMCGAGTILGEAIGYARHHRLGTLQVLGGDGDTNAVRAAGINLRHLGPARLERWDATRLPLADASIDRIVCNPPFGKQLSQPAKIGPLYRRLVPEFDRVLKPAAQLVLLVSEAAVLKEAARGAGWKLLRHFPVRVLGQPAVITVWRKPA